MPGMFANASVILAPEPNVLTVPETALDHTIYGDSIYLVRKTAPTANSAATLVATRQLVKIGSRIGNQIIIREGLSAGDWVVTIGQLKLHDGAEVAPVKSDSLSDSSAMQKTQPQ